MPSSPKRTPNTGSPLLGQELRRLRGGSTLREICDITRNPPLSGHVGVIAMASLCEIESGKTMPSLQTMHALSVVYRTSMSQLMAYVTEERHQGAAASSLASSSASPTEQFAGLLAQSRWADALLLAGALERSAAEPAAQEAWRANRASCLSRMGLHDEAASLFSRCCESVHISDRTRFHLLANFAVTHLTAGHLYQAEVFLDRALELASQLELSDEELAPFRALRAESIVAHHFHGHAVSERKLREALRLFESSRASQPAAPRDLHVRLSIEQALCYLALGNRLVAARDARQALDEAGAIGNATLKARAEYALGEIALAGANTADAIERFDRAATVGESCGYDQMVFEASFRLFLLLKDSRPGQATTMLRRCQTLSAVITARTPLFQQFMEVMKARS